MRRGDLGMAVPLAGNAASRVRRNVGGVATLACLMALLAFGAAQCNNLCSGHGRCSSGSLTTCACFDGWGGGDCSLRLCPVGTAWADEATAVDVAHAPAECSNKGVCDYRTGKCMCQEGFEGLACSRMVCKNECSYHGRCVSMERAAVDAQFTIQTGTYSNYGNNWDYSMIYGCQCDVGFEGYDCSLRQCPRGDDPMTTNQMNEIQLIYCRATSGYFVLYLDGKMSERIPFSASGSAIQAALQPIAGAVIVTFPNGGSTACTSNGAIVSVEFRDRYGDVPPMTIKRDWATYLSCTACLPASADLFVVDGTGAANTLTPHSFTVGSGTASANFRRGNKEWEYCSRRGRCNQENALCECYTGFYSSDGYNQPGDKGDCGAALDPVASCPGVPLECSGHGSCSDYPEYKCTCEEGWTSGDCSERICPFGYAWFDTPQGTNDVAHYSAECSNKGICNRNSGKCNCEKGWTGDACDRMMCPQVDADKACSSHGICMSMSQLAEVANLNGDATSYTYGLNRHNPVTWDSEHVWGCHCDEGWHGYDCSLKDCPTGDDPHTPGVPEIQEIRCRAAAGSFVLSFRQYRTEAINFDDTADELKAKLDAVHTIHGVTVAIQGGGAALCSAGSIVSTTVTFNQDMSNVPSLIVVSSTLSGTSAAVSIIADGTSLSRQGTTENAVCSNRGICDEVSGVCQCFRQWGSSNGNNGPGEREDCGYVLPFLTRGFLRADKRALELREIERRQAERAQSTAVRTGFEHGQKSRRRRIADEDQEWPDHGFTKYTWAQDQFRDHGDQDWVARHKLRRDDWQARRDDARGEWLGRVDGPFD